MTKEDVQAEILRELLGKMSREDMERNSENLGIPPSQIRSLMRWIGKEE